VWQSLLWMQQLPHWVAAAADKDSSDTVFQSTCPGVIRASARCPSGGLRADFPGL
jgi:hypothetical protein